MADLESALQALVVPTEQADAAPAVDVAAVEVAASEASADADPPHLCNPHCVAGEVYRLLAKVLDVFGQRFDELELMIRSGFEAPRMSTPAMRETLASQITAPAGHVADVTTDAPDLAAAREARAVSRAEDWRERHGPDVKQYSDDGIVAYLAFVSAVSPQQITSDLDASRQGRTPSPRFAITRAITRLQGLKGYEPPKRELRVYQHRPAMAWLAGDVSSERRVPRYWAIMYGGVSEDTLYPQAAVADAKAYLAVQEANQNAVARQQQGGK